jgi:ankyrin repeat protein
MTLLYECKNGNIKNVRSLIKNGSNANESDETGVDGVSPLFIASQEGHLDIVKYLILHGAANIPSTLFIACHQGHLHVVKYLIEHVRSAKVVPTDDGATCLHVAVQERHLHIVKYLIENGAAGVDVKMSKGATALHIASQSGNLPTVKYLIEYGLANVNLAMKNGSTALFIASARGDLAIVRCLIEHGSTDISTALSIASAYGMDKVADYLARERNWQRRCAYAIVMNSLKTDNSDTAFSRVLQSFDTMRLIGSFL